jgi:hypothetical protein
MDIKKIEQRIAQLRNSTGIYQEPPPEMLKASLQIEFQIVNESRQGFPFEQQGERFRMQEVSASGWAPYLTMKRLFC